MWEIEVIVCSKKKRPKLLITIITVLVLRLMSQNPETGDSVWRGFWLQKKRFISYQQSDQRYDSRGLWLMVGQSVVWVSLSTDLSQYVWLDLSSDLWPTPLSLMLFTISIFKRGTPSLPAFFLMFLIADFIYSFFKLPHVPMCSTSSTTKAFMCWLQLQLYEKKKKKKLNVLEI